MKVSNNTSSEEVFEPSAINGYFNGEKLTDNRRLKGNCEENTTAELTGNLRDNVTIRHYPISGAQAQDLDEIQQVQSDCTQRQSEECSKSCGCRCHHTHHHHHHHTIVINADSGNFYDRNSQSRFAKNLIHKSSRKNVTKTKSCPAWADGSCRTGESIPNEGAISIDEILSKIHNVGNGYTPQSRNYNSNNEPFGAREYTVEVETENRCSERVNKQLGCCRTLRPGIAILVTVLVFVIFGLLSGLIYFLTNGTVASEGDSSIKRNIPSISTTLNQTMACGKYPTKYLSPSARAFYAKQTTSDVYPTENDSGANSARITGGVPAHAAQYPWQEFQSSVVFDDSRGSLVDASMVQPRIFGGKDTDSSRFPWQVSLWVSHRGMTCGGSLIMHNWVLTAAHCTDANPDAHVWTAYAGMSRMSDKLLPPAQSSKVILVIQHPNYIKDFSYDYDVSLMKLKHGMNFTPTVQPICLPTSEFNDGAECYISGWGATTNAGQANSPNTLQHAQVDVIGYGTCRQDDWLGDLVTDRMLCAGKADGSRDACQGDSGGPLSCYDNLRKTWTLAGSVSWGIECGQPQHPGVYAKMSFFVDWIWLKIGQHDNWTDDEHSAGSGDDELLP